MSAPLIWLFGHHDAAAGHHDAAQRRRRHDAGADADQPRQDQRKAQILAAEGAKRATILAAEGERQSRILRAEVERAAQYLQAQGQAKAIEKTFAAIKRGRPTPELLAYQYLQTLPQMAKGEANEVWLVPSDFGSALQGFAKMLGAPGSDGVFRYQPSPMDTDTPQDDSEEFADWFTIQSEPAIAAVVRSAPDSAPDAIGGPPTG